MTKPLDSITYIVTNEIMTDTDTDTEALRYDKMVEGALRGVVRQAVEEVINDGLAGDHHFFITFTTDHPGVKIPDYLRERYPGEMTIVLQYQFHDLYVDAGRMEVTLSFNNVPERLIVPLPAITIFADPSVNFALQFQPLADEDEDPEFDPDGTDDDSDKSNTDEKPTSGGSEAGQVVSLDQFRKK